MQKIAFRSCLAAGAAVTMAMVAACDPPSLSSAAAKPAAGAPVHLTERIAPSALVTVAGGTVTGRILSRPVAVTARPNEDLDIVQDGPRPRILLASVSPAPAKVIVPGQPAPLGPGASSYQSGLYRNRRNAWFGEIATGNQMVVSRTEAAVSRWTRALRLPDTVIGLPSSLAAECAAATSAVTGLGEAGGRFGTRRVLLLYVANLGGTLHAGELAGDDVIVITPFLPTTAAASAAQADLLGAGAVRAAVLGPEEAASQLDQLIAIGLSQKVISEPLSGAVLFANNSAVLLPGAARVLVPLLPLLRRPGVTGVVNGYASTPGGASRNDQLSQSRAVAVALFFEARGIPASCLLAVGHGASHLTAPGPSGANRRVVVTIQEP